MVPTPNTRDVIAGRVDLTVDFRDLNPATLDTLFATIARLAAEIAAATKTRFTIRTTQRMPSGAGHDAQSMARIAPMAMIFVPSVGGISHAPQEYTAPEDCAHGADGLQRGRTNPFV